MDDKIQPIASSNGEIAWIGGAIGGAGGKSASWGDTITLTDADAFLMSNGKCAFNVTYDMDNTGGATVVPFKNWLVAKDSIVAINSNLILNAGESRLVSTQPYLPQGSYELQLRLGTENNITESNESNNVATVKINFDGLCGAPPPAPAPKPDLVSQRGIAIGGKTAAWGGIIALRTSDSFLQSNGKCAFNITYDIANAGAATTGKTFINRIYSGSTLVSQQTGPILDAGQSRLIVTQAYLTPGTNVIYLLADVDNGIAESNESNNVTSVKVTLDSTCGVTKTSTSSIRK